MYSTNFDMNSPIRNFDTAHDQSLLNELDSCQLMYFFHASMLLLYRYMLGILCILAHLHCILHYRRSFIQMLWSSQSNLIRWKMLLAARLSPLLWWGCQVLRLYFVLYHFSILFATRSFTVIHNVSATAYLLSTCVPYSNCVLWHGGLYSNRVLETPPCVLSVSLCLELRES